MSKTKNLMKRGNVFYGRVAVPKELRLLRAAAGVVENPKEIFRSLGTSDHKIVGRLLPEFMAGVLREFDVELDRLQSKGVRPMVQPSAQDLADVRQEFFVDELQRDDLERNLRKSRAEVDVMREQLVARLAKLKPTTPLELVLAPGVIELDVAQSAADMSTERRGYLAAELKRHLAESNYVLVSDVIEHASVTKGLDFKPDSLQYKTLARGLIKEWLNALDVADRRDHGVHDDDHLMTREAATGGGDRSRDRHSDVVDLAKERTRRPAKGESMRSYFDRFMREEKSHVKPNDAQTMRATLRQFIECNGDRHVSDYGKADMAAYKRGLKEYPANAAKLYPGVKFKTVIERNRQDGHPTLNSNTIRSKLGFLAVFGRWLEDNEDNVDASNFATSLPKRDDRERMEPFSLDDVRRILNSSAFVGCLSANNYQKPGLVKVRDWRFWMTLIAAFTGARVNEIVQMDITDLRLEGDIWAFDITDEGDGQSLKTITSKRLLPVHPQLIELGLLDYRDGLVARGATSLFQDVPVGRNGRRSEAAGRWFRKFLQRIGVKSKEPGKLGGSHRWRHTLTDELRRVDVDTYNISATLGHRINIARMTSEYGRAMDMSLSKRLEFLSKASYPGVDFDRLKSGD